MKALKTRPKYSTIDIRALALIYLLFTVLTFFFSRSFLSDLLREGGFPETRNLIAFLIIPGALLVFLVISGLGIARDIMVRRPESRFQFRLIIYFAITIVLAASPLVIITNLSVSELGSFWKTLDINTAMNEAQRFAMESYSLNIEKLEDLVNEGAFDSSLPQALPASPAEREAEGPLPANVICIEDFVEADGEWSSSGFSGSEEGRLEGPPLPRQGLVPRELPRDTDMIRYVISYEPGLLRTVSWSLGEGFDSGLAGIEEARTKFEAIDSITGNLRRLLVFYYGVFFLPALFMTLNIALTFARRLTFPLRDLAEATRRVAEGDLSIQILPHRGDELAHLTQSFNTMVQDLQKSRAALFKSEKISVWQTMAQQLAHEIKNPLTPIRLSAERVLRRWQNEPEKIGEILEKSMMVIVQETESLATLLTEFRTLSRPMEPSDSWTDIREVVNEIVSAYRTSHPDTQFDPDKVEPGISVKIEKHRLTQILTNLVINGIDAMDGKGLIEFRTDLVKKRENRYCRLSIRDTGRGIAEEDAEKVFTPYFTTKESGTGLGLPIVERIVNDHGGSIWFNSAPGAGTVFFIDLPLPAEREL
jgi:nitrogen fixation/metabolism regulation signal transduction histidine kinase